MCILFLDFKSAYNTVDRSRLYNILRKNNLLEAQEIDFLETLHNKLYFIGKNQKFYFKKGVH
jgi:hypothetical protein